MRFSAYQGERTLSELVDRLFHLRGPKAKELARMAETALLTANPQLRDLETAPVGAMVAVPDVAGAAPTGESHPVEMPGRELVEQVRQALHGVRVALATSAAGEAEEAKETLKLVKSRGLKGMAENVPEVGERLSKIAEAANANLKQAEALRTTQERCLAQLEKDLGALIKRLT